MNLLFGLYPLRFTFIARQPVYFPEGKSANILRGALGTIFRRLACVPGCTGPRHCEWGTDCPYARTFEPSASVAAHANCMSALRPERVQELPVPTPSGLGDWPRPFVFRATHLDACRFDPGAGFHFDLHLFDLQRPALEYLVAAFGALAQDGLGPRRGRVELSGVWEVDAERQPSIHLYDGFAVSPHHLVPIEMQLAVPKTSVSRIRVRFVTPTELKHGKKILEQPEFGALAARIRDRVSTLRALYGDGPLEIDFRAFGERAAAVRMTDFRMVRMEATRRSSRTGHSHPIGGFVGDAEYEGDLTEFIPYLRAAEWTGVGRQTVWGKGEIALEILG